MTPFNSIVDPNPVGLVGRPAADPRSQSALPHPNGRDRRRLSTWLPATSSSSTAAPWLGCTRTMLRNALAETEGRNRPFPSSPPSSMSSTLPTAASRPAHSMSFAALRRTDPFAPQFDGGAGGGPASDPKWSSAEFGDEQFESDARAGRCADGRRPAAVAIREITREVARNAGWRASFAPKTAPNAVGNWRAHPFQFRRRGRQAGDLRCGATRRPFHQGRRLLCRRACAICQRSPP